MAGFDPTKLKHTDAELPERTRVVSERKWDDNPFIEPLRQTMGEGSKGKAVKVPARHAREVAGGIRDAAEKITAAGEPTGVRVVFVLPDGSQTSKAADVPADSDEPVQVLYRSRERRRTLTDGEKAEAIREGFVNDKGRPVARDFYAWVDAGRPREIVPE